MGRKKSCVSDIPRIFFVVVCGVWCTVTSAQTVSLNLSGYEEAIRRAQLLGEVDSMISFNVRPLYIHGHKAPLWKGMDSIGFSKKLINLKKARTSLEILPLQFYNEFNSDYPYGWNNGSLLRSRGLQSQISGGIYSKVGPLHIQLRPELNFVQNSAYQDFYDTHRLASNASTLLEYYYHYHYNRTDLPDSFGSRGLYKAMAGQSSAKFSYGGYALGVSTENVWWGPGIRNSLLMSNNSRGFSHATFQTTKPSRTFIGSFEGQILAGRLESSGYLPPQQRLSIAKRSSWRYLTGFNISYTPRWTPGLFLGMSRTIQQYWVHTQLFDDYFPIVMNFFRKNDDIIDDRFYRDQYVSVYLRWLWKQANAELYFEFGRNDASYHFRDFLMTPEHSRAYTFGFMKLSPLGRKDRFIQIHAEITQLQQSVNYVIRNALNWYTHFQIRHGYTHAGEVIGAGIGPGSNVQFMEVSWTERMNKVGLQIERLVNNNDFYYYAFSRSNIPSRQWVDLSGGVNIRWQLNQFLLSAKAQYIRSFNYWWEEAPESTPFAYKGKDVSNLFLTFGVIYGFK